MQGHNWLHNNEIILLKSKVTSLKTRLKVYELVHKCLICKSIGTQLNIQLLMQILVVKGQEIYLKLLIKQLKCQGNLVVTLVRSKGYHQPK